MQSLDVTGPLEVFAGARDHQGERAYRVRTASLGGAQVRTTSGLAIVPDGDLRDEGRADPPDLLIVPGGAGARCGDPDLVGWIGAHAPRSSRVASVCTGAFLLAEAGLLDGRRATTHWSQCAALRDQYPAVKVDPDPIFVKDGNVATSPAVTWKTPRQASRRPPVPAATARQRPCAARSSRPSASAPPSTAAGSVLSLRERHANITRGNGPSHPPPDRDRAV
jgi:putative intracellular protease/amidase